MLVTVIVAIYNVEAYIKDCVQSILNQTYRNLEIILVDDGSQDNCGDICDRFAQMDNRIKVIHQPNGGLSAARNSGLDFMSGDAVTFVDGDDSLDERMIEFMVEDMKLYDADIVEGQFYHVYKNRIDVQKSLTEIKVYSPEEAFLIDLSSKGGSVSACAKLYRRKIFYNHRFMKNRFYEDLLAISETLRQADNVVIDYRPMYYYYHRENSITATKFSEKDLDLIKAAEVTLKATKKYFPSAIIGAYFRYDHTRLQVIDRILLDDKWRKNPYLPSLIKYIRIHLFRILRNPYFTRNRKLGAVIAAISPCIYRKIVVRELRKKWN